MKKIAEANIPHAMKAVAGLYRLFWNETHPDLTASANVSSNYVSGQTGVQIPVTVYRSGANLTKGTYVHAKLYWSSNSTWDTNDTVLWSSNDSIPDFPNSTLNSSGSKTVIATINIPQVSAGTYYIIAYADAPTSSYPNGYQDEINETNNTASYSVSVTPAPTIARSPTSLSNSCIQGQNAPAQSFEVWNSGGGTLSYNISDDATWLSCSPTSGTSTGEHDAIAVTYSTSGLSAGTYNATITITASGATNTPQTIPVTLTVNPLSPTISRSPASLTNSTPQGQNASSQSFEVWNSGGGTLSYSISDDATWLSCSPTSGTSTGEHDAITVTYSTSGLSAGTYSATITINASGATNSPQTIAVNLTVNAVETGTLSVTTTPVSGYIYVDGVYKGAGSWSGSVAAGSHTVSFGAVTGYDVPADQTVTVYAGQTTYVTGIYTPVQQMGTLSVTTTPVSGDIYVDNQYKGNGSWSGLVSVGSHTVSFGSVPGYDTPPPQTVNVILNQTTSVIGTYTPAEPSQSVKLPMTGQTISYYEGDDGDLQIGVAWPDPRFVDNGDQTITDNLTGLTWTKDASTPTFGSCTGGKRKWQQALDYVSCLNANSYLGRTDWRMPNINELESILLNMDETSLTAWLHSQGFVNVQTYSYWSSTTTSDYSGSAWVIYTGWPYYIEGYEKTWDFYVWPVRTGGILRQKILTLGQRGRL